MTNKAGEQPTITQEDINAATALYNHVQSNQDRYQDWEQAFAKHRTTSLAAQDGLVDAVTRFMPTNINLANKNVDDREILPLDVTFGELRAISAALSAIKGDKS